MNNRANLLRSGVVVDVKEHKSRGFCFTLRDKEHNVLTLFGENEANRDDWISAISGLAAWIRDTPHATAGSTTPNEEGPSPLSPSASPLSVSLPAATSSDDVTRAEKAAKRRTLAAPLSPSMILSSSSSDASQQQPSSSPSSSSVLVEKSRKLSVADNIVTFFRTSRNSSPSSSSPIADATLPPSSPASHKNSAAAARVGSVSPHRTSPILEASISTTTTSTSTIDIEVPEMLDAIDEVPAVVVATTNTKDNNSAAVETSTSSSSTGKKAKRMRSSLALMSEGLNLSRFSLFSCV